MKLHQLFLMLSVDVLARLAIRNMFCFSKKLGLLLQCSSSSWTRGSTRLYPYWGIRMDKNEWMRRLDNEWMNRQTASSCNRSHLGLAARINWVRKTQCFGSASIIMRIRILVPTFFQRLSWIYCWIIMNMCKFYCCTVTCTYTFLV